MSGIKRKIEDKDPDYEDISVVHENKRQKAVEQNARDATIQKIEAIIKDQFSLELKNKEHEIEVIVQRLNEARRMMDKLRACIVANYYASAGQPKVSEGAKSDPSVFNHPAIKRFLESPSRSSSPLNQGSETPSLVPSETESLTQLSEGLDREGESSWKEPSKQERRPGRNTGKDTFGVSAPQEQDQRFTFLTTGEDSSRLYVKKTIVVGNVSKYIPPDKREENDQSTHKWMVYVRGSRKEPTIDHFVKKVWFFLHPSYKPNDLVEVSEPPFHLTRRGWGEFPVRVQIHFKDPRNKRIDIIHHLKLDRTYTGLQTLGAETVVDVELHRNSLGEDFFPFPCSSSRQPASAQPDTPSSAPQTPGPSAGRSSSPVRLTQDSLSTAEKGFPIKSEAGRSTGYTLLSSERTPTRPKATEKITLGSHGNSAFQPITASCKIVPQGQAPNPAESPGKSFQPITMSCKIVSGSPISTPSHSPLPRTPTSTPVHMKPASSVINNPYIIVDKPGQGIGMASSAAGSPTGKQSSSPQVSQGARSPAPKVHGTSFITSGVKEESLFAAMPPLCPIGSQSKVQSTKPLSGGLGAFTKVIIKQEPGEAPQQQQQQQMLVSTATSQQPAQQFVAVKGGHMIAVSPQKQTSAAGAGATQNKVVGIPVGSALQSAVKQAVAISSGQILVAKSSPAASKVMGQKQVIAQGVAKAIVSGASGTIVGQSVQTVTKAQSSSAGTAKTGGQGSVMATLQLPANNLANLANLPPGTKLYLTTNSKNPSGKGKLLLIPQGAILRASNPSGQQSQSATTTSGGGSQTPTSSSLPQNLSCTSYILKQTPQGTFLVGQPAPQGSGKQGAAGSSGHSVSSPSSITQQAIRVTAGQKAAILAQVVGGTQGSTVKLSDGSVKAAHLSKPGTTTLRMTGGVITAASSAGAPAGLATVPAAQQPPEVGSSSLAAPGAKPVVQHPVLVAASQAAVISVAKSASSSAATVAKSAIPAMVTVAKSVNVPVVSIAKGASSAVVSVPKSASPSLVTAASLVTSGTTVSGKTAATLSGMLKIHSGQSNTQQAVLTIPANQLKQLGVSTATGGVQTILMPVSKVVQSSSVTKVAGAAVGPTAASTPSTVPSGSAQHPPLTSTAQVKTEPGVAGPSTSSAAVPSVTAPMTVKVEQGTEIPHEYINTDHVENLHQLLTAVVKKIPLIVPEKTEDSSAFCAVSLEQYYSWNIGKRRAAELQRAVAVKKAVQEVIEKLPKFSSIAPPKTKQVMQWCRQRGYTPPDLEPRRTEEDSIEDILTQIDNEPECPSTLYGAGELCQRLEELQRLLKTEPEEEEEILDIVSVKEPVKVEIKMEEEELNQESKFYIGASPSAQFIRDCAQQIGVPFQQVEVEKNVYAPAVEEMILKATEQLASEVLREALAVAYKKSPQNRVPREITAMNIHQAVSTIPACDFLTNKHMGVLIKEGHAD
ncbi:YEATS domain-containing protein 2 isoform X1 [Lepisosteus oculatus]|uniref:YEATS domain-containing protein 2 isoform X1 n=1 Tax=Lepisosteus oculatus TaxID=7918 RepID=UPI0035F51DC6